MSKEKTDFARRLVSIRKRKGLTQVELAQKTGASLEMVKYYETRAKSPNSSTLLRISGALSVGIDELIGEGVRGKPGPESEVEKCFDRVARLPKKRQKKVLAVIDTLIEN